MRTEIFTVLAVTLAVLGIVRVLTTTDLVRRVIALNIASGGVLMALLVLATRSDPPDTVPHALALTGIVITVSVTGLALVLIRRIESVEAGSSANNGDDGDDSADGADGDAGDDGDDDADSADGADGEDEPGGGP